MGCRGKQRNDRGAVLVLTAVLLVALVGVAALVVDLGRLRLAKQRARHVCDASAMAAAWYLEPVDAGSHVVVADVAMETAATNNQSANQKVLQPGSSSEGVGVSFPDAWSVDVTGEAKVDFGFARMMGFTSSRAAAAATAKLESNAGFAYPFLPLGVMPLIQGRLPGADQVSVKLSTPYWFMSDGSMGSPSNLFPIVSQGNSYDQTVYEDLLGGNGESYRLATDDSATAIQNDVAELTETRLNHRIAADSWDWTAWVNATDEQKATSQRIVILPVVSRISGSNLRVVGFTGFFLERVQRFVDTAGDLDPTNDRHLTNLYGHYVPGVVGAKSIHWLKPAFSASGSYGTLPLGTAFRSKTNLTYRVRLTH